MKNPNFKAILSLSISFLSFFFFLNYSFGNTQKNVLTFPALFNLTTLNGKNGFAFNGTSPGSVGFSIKGAGDINGDGIPDMLIFFADGNDINKVYVVFGRVEPWPASISLDFIDGTNGFVIIGQSAGFFNIVACAVGDVNGDGIDDILMGDPGANNQAGQSYILYGSKGPWAPEFYLSDLNGKNGFSINGVAENDFSGSFVSGLGDVNGDGILDFMIGTGFRGVLNITNQIYVVFGTKAPRPASINLSDLNGKNGFTINGMDPNDVGSYAIASLGDINGDGLNDILIGNPSASNYTGQSYVIFGKKTPWASQFNLTSLNGDNGFYINGISPNDYSGYTVSGVGDVNKDGLDDILIASKWANQYGQIYIIFGSKNPWHSTINLKNLNGKNGFTINGVPMNGGYTIDGAGDINSDGFDDIFIGASWVNNETGQSFIVYGNRNYNPFVNLTNLDGTNGLVINGINEGDWCGDSLTPAGDFNKDGIADFSLGASHANQAAGQAYIIYGQKKSSKPIKKKVN
ncbi:MAG: hypothetical protein C5B43_04820 [Verrucomicrobia bacterium]|nr:MAG: hypothetical protein C5B43_04820 [Verrucomicrobiota bacterium]